MKRLTQNQFETWLKEIGGSIALTEFNRLNKGGNCHLINGNFDNSFYGEDSSLGHTFWDAIEQEYSDYFSTFPEPVRRTLFDVLELLDNTKEGFYLNLGGFFGNAIYHSDGVLEKSFESRENFDSDQEYINHIYNTISKSINKNKDTH